MQLSLLWVLVGRILSTQFAMQLPRQRSEEAILGPLLFLLQPERHSEIQTDIVLWPHLFRKGEGLLSIQILVQVNQPSSIQSIHQMNQSIPTKPGCLFLRLDSSALRNTPAKLL